MDVAAAARSIRARVSSRHALSASHRGGNTAKAVATPLPRMPLAEHHASLTTVDVGQHQNHRLALGMVPTFQGRHPGVLTPRAAEAD